jgi:phospholipid/cholesterol/gamma-HCH transport system substrate-binding protein
MSAAGRTRMLAFGALFIAVAAVLIVIVGARGGRTYHLLFSDASGLVKGDQVQVGGVVVGSVTALSLSPSGEADVTVRVDAPIAPLHQGTTALIRVPSLAGVANRYISLTPGANNVPTLPDGATFPTTATQSAVDLDQLLDTFDPATRRALAQVIGGSATAVRGVAAPLHRDAALLDPSLLAADRVFAALTRDDGVLTDFLLTSSRVVTALSARAPQLTGLVNGASSTFGALGSEDTSLRLALSALPGALAAGTRAFRDLPPALDDAQRLLDAARPVARPLTTVLRPLAPLLAQATPALGDLAAAVSAPGPANDLTDALRSLPALSHALASTGPDTTAALAQSTPILASARPYAPDLAGALRDFGQTGGFYDANGHYVRVSPVFAEFQGATGALTPTTPAQGLAPLQTGQLLRCPGGAGAPGATSGCAP